MQTFELTNRKKVPEIGRAPIFPAGTQSCGLLEKFVQQEMKQPEKKHKVTADNKMKMLEATLRKLCRKSDLGWDERYQYACKLAKKMEYRALDLEHFSAHLPQIKGIEKLGYAVGLYLSALVNEGSEKEFQLHALEPIWLLGYRNTKRLRVKGDLGGETGMHMKAGLMAVEGSAGDFAGSDMTGGKLVIKGHAKSWVGRKMEGGKIIVHGSAKGQVGKEMKGGYIHIRGSGGHMIGDSMSGGVIWIEMWHDASLDKSSLSEYIYDGIICSGRGKGFWATRYGEKNGHKRINVEMEQPRE